MPIQHSPPSRQTGSQARTQAILTSTPRAPLMALQQNFKDHFQRSWGRLEEEGENSVEEEESYVTEGIPAPVGESQGTEGPTLAQSNQPFSHQSEPSFLAIMQQMTQNMANL
ncbi:hypothetical protein O181_044727 [Austropuccinia psidii MF-1]|uniref:Uncharacterized protein n=1 Tax=Austropuccinia psidii MF-1 TaxID=1389203 RepID=A0A9Q3DN01_9BASI|nr:hypothetical protein [Austropuccinia psidii MF-1]